MSATQKWVSTLFDRLLDERPQQRTETDRSHLYSLNEYKAALIRDLELLVNTRQCLPTETLAAYPSLSGSILEYGLPDFTGKTLLAPHERRMIQQQLEHAIAVGDRRFRQVRVQLMEQQPDQRHLTFRVDAVLKLPDAVRQVSFDAVLQINTKEYTVQNLN